MMVRGKGWRVGVVFCIGLEATDGKQTANRRQTVGSEMR